MKKSLYLLAAILVVAATPASGETISISGPGILTASSFDVVVEAQNLFAGRDPLTDMIISYGFNVTVSDPAIFSFTGATSGALFDPATTEPGTNVFGAASGFGIDSSAPDPLILATLHFQMLASGTADILISSNLANPFQGLQYLNSPFQEPISGKLTVTAVPEPGTLLLLASGLIALALWRRRSISYHSVEWKNKTSIP